MKKLLPLALLLCACQSHLIPRIQWTTLNGYKPSKPVLLEAEDGMFYLTTKAELAFVRKDGREINRKWQEITLAKNEFTAISVDREVFTFPLSDLERIVAYGKLAGEITGVVPDTGPRPGPAGPAAGMRPMY